jgi:hypothetical protein
MATRSTIAKENADGTITSVYCHWDGYPEGVGQTLADHYTDPAKIDQLLALGDLSVLDAEIGDSNDFDNRIDGICLFYGRDRGETGTYALPHMDIEGWKAVRLESGCEYGYLWMNGTTVWTTFKISRSDDNE